MKAQDLTAPRTGGNHEIHNCFLLQRFQSKCVNYLLQFFRLERFNFRSLQLWRCGLCCSVVKIKEYGDRMKVLETERDDAAQNANQYTELNVILNAFEQGIKDGSIMSTDDATIMRSLVHQIIVRETEIEIEFKCGAVITKEYVR